MLPLARSCVPLCEGATRREWLRVGGLTALGLTMPELLRAKAASGALSASAATSFGRAKSCIIAFLFGGPAHQDIWDLKPEAPSDLRGEFRPIATSVPGLQVSEHIPRIAQQAHRFALIRSVTHPDQTHTIAMHYMLTGHRHPQPSTNPQNQPTDFPTFGAVMQHLRPSPGVLPSGISLNSPANQLSANNHIFPGFFAGFLGQRCDPLFVSENPSAAEFQPFRGAEGWPAARLSNAEGLRRELTRHRQALDAAGATRSFDAFHERAYSLIASPEAQAAFNLSREPQHLRDRYGRTPFGQGLLLARRLVEAGVCLTTVNWSRDYEVQPGDMFFWDTHARNFPLLKDKLLPVFDQGFSALLEDLDERGLLHQTLVVCLGEFGRTPKISSNGGREHWPGCHSVVLAGAGIRGGQVYGASDKIAAWPDSDPVSPEDLAATIYHALGVDLQTELRDHLGRPRYLCEGKPLLALFG